MSVVWSPSGKGRNDLPPGAFVEQAGFTVRIDDRGPSASSFENLQAALVENTTDCILVPGEVAPQSLADGVSLAAVLPRRSARLCLVGAAGSLHPTPSNPIGLDPGAIVAAPSLGRQTQLLALCQNLMIVDRMPQAGSLASALRDQTLDAVLIPVDDVDRLEVGDLVLIELGPEIMLPPPGSGTTVIVARTGDPLGAVLASLDDPDTRRCLSAERSLAEALGRPAGLACLATPEADGAIRLQATMARMSHQLPPAAGDASDPRSALVRVGAVASTPESAAELCLLALQECAPGGAVSL